MGRAPETKDAEPVRAPAIHLCRFVTQNPSKHVWAETPAGSAFAKDVTPGTKEFFDRTRHLRHTVEMPWLFDVFPFASCQGKKVLEIGCGSGYDALTFCENGADYTGIDITPQNIERAKKHLAFYQFHPPLIEMDAEKLSFENRTFDMVFSNGVLHHTPHIYQALSEIQRVLKPEGEFCVIVYHRDSIVHWLSMFFVEHILRGGFLKRSFRERLSMVEYTTSTHRPLVETYSRGELKALLSAVGLRTTSMAVRKLVSEDLPDIPILSRHWKRIPQRWLDRLGHYFGWYVIARGHKMSSFV